MANLRYCSFCGSLTTKDGVCDCTNNPSSAQRGWIPSSGSEAGQRHPPGWRRPSNHDPERDKKRATRWMIVGAVGLLAFVAVCSYMVDGTPENRSVQQETNNLAVYQRMNINLGDCYRWLLRFDEQTQNLLAAGYHKARAEEISIEDQRRDHIYAEYRAILQRCGVLWGQATEQEKIKAMRDSGVH